MMETGTRYQDLWEDGDNQQEETVERYEVTLGDLFNESFLTRHTKVSSIEEFFHSGQFDPHSLSEIVALEKKELDAHVRQMTSFQDWEGMLNQAVSELFAQMIQV